MGKLFNELKDLKAAYDRKLRDEGQAAVKDAFKDFFDQYPEVRSVKWSQYTPYFNDGDTCHFGVNEFEAVVVSTEALKAEIEEKKRLTIEAANAAEYKKAQLLKEEVEDLQNQLNNEDDCDGNSAWSLSRKKDPRLIALGEALNNIERELLHDVLESVFGDHVEVIATREGFKTREYNHD
jgi:hypothetical protein